MRKRDKGQTYEIRVGVAYAITTVQKDSLYVGKVMRDQENRKSFSVIGNYHNHDASRIVYRGGCTPTVKENHGTVTATVRKKKICKIFRKEDIKLANVEDYLYKDFGVFKLSPRECGRLMGVRDSDIDKMMEVNSKTQCYKQYGNSIVVPVLMAIFSQLGLPGVKKWNELSQDQRQELVAKNMDFLEKGGET